MRPIVKTGTAALYIEIVFQWTTVSCHLRLFYANHKQTYDSCVAHVYGELGSLLYILDI
jgi:hypothetical protein